MIFSNHLSLTPQLPLFQRTSAFPRLEDYMRAGMGDHRHRLPVVTRGATQNTIEKNTFPHKYKKVSNELFIGIWFLKDNKCFENSICNN